MRITPASRNPSLRRDMLVYGVGEFAVKAFGLITLPLYTHIFSPDDFGIVGIVLTLSGLTMAILGLGSDVAYVRYFFAAKTLEERQTVTSTWIPFLAIWSTGAAVLAVPLSEPLGVLAIGEPGYRWLVALAVLLAPVRLTNLMLGQVLRSQFRALAYTATNVASLALSIVLIALSILALDLGISGVLVGMLSAEALMLPARIWMARSMLAPRFSGRLLGQLVRYGAPIVPASLAYWVFTASDRILLSNLASLEEVGLYAAAASIVSSTTVAVTALAQAWGPHAFRAFESDPAAASVLYGRMLTWVTAAFGFVAVALTAFSRELVTGLTGQEFAGAAKAVGPLALGVVAYATTQVTSGGVQLMRKTGYLAVLSWLAAAVNIALNVVLIPSFGMIGAAAATAIAYVTLTIAYMVASERVWHVAYETRRTLTVAVLTIAFVLGAYVVDAIPQFHTELGIKAGYCVLFVVSILALRGLTLEEIGSSVRTALPSANSRLPD